jgi:hypothetical protein
MKPPKAEGRAPRGPAPIFNRCYSQNSESGGGRCLFDLRATRARFHRTAPRRRKFAATIPACTLRLFSMRLLHRSFGCQGPKLWGGLRTFQGFCKSLRACLLIRTVFSSANGHHGTVPTKCKRARADQRRDPPRGIHARNSQFATCQPVRERTRARMISLRIRFGAGYTQGSQP